MGVPQITGRERTERDRLDDGRPEVEIASLAGPRRRRPTFVVVGLLLVAASALAGALLIGALTTTVPVVVAATDLEAGHVLTESDLRVVELSELGPAATVEVGEQSSILGLATRGPVPAGTLLNEALFIDPTSAVPDGMAVIGADLDPGAAAGSGLRPGDRVDLLGTRPTTSGLDTGAPGGEEADVLGTGTVWAVEPPAPGSAGRIVVTVLVPADVRATAAQAAADDRLRLARVPG